MDRRNLLVLVLAAGTGFYAYAVENPKIKTVPVTPTSAASGIDMFKAYCAACHGLDAKGNGPAAPALKKQPTDLTQLSKANGGPFPGLRVIHVIEGRDELASHGSRDMPVWGPIFRSMERNTQVTTLRLHNLAGYIEGVQEK
jgi:mono/diheme cytochrome c family protein